MCRYYMDVEKCGTAASEKGVCSLLASICLIVHAAQRLPLRKMRLIQTDEYPYLTVLSPVTNHGK